MGVFPGHHVKVQEKSVNIGLRKLEEVPYRKYFSRPPESNNSTCVPCQCFRENMFLQAAKSVVDMQVPNGSGDV